MMCMTTNLINAFLLRVVIVRCQWQRWVEYCSAFELANQAPVKVLLNRGCDKNEQRALVDDEGQEKRCAWDVVVQVLPRSARRVCKSALQDVQIA
jgi:hypothetical protein